MTKTRVSPREICRAGLEVLIEERLIALAVGLGVDASGTPGTLQKRLARHERLGARKLLDYMTVFELGDACRALGVDSQGRSADTLRGRLLGVDDYRGDSSPADERREVPLELRGSRRDKGRSLLKHRAKNFMRRSFGVVMWSAAAAGLTYFLMGVLTESADLRQNFAAVSFGACSVVKARRMGRFGGMFFYGVPIIAATYAGYAHEMLDLEMASQSRLGLVWGSSVVAGAFIGLAEEIGGDMH